MGIMNIPIGPNQPGCIGQRPTLRPGVNLCFGLAFGATKGETVHFGEVERALSLPVLGVDGARHKTGDTRWCATGEKRISVSKIQPQISSDILLPVEQWLITQEPLPLSVNGIVHRNIRKDRAGRIIGIKARSGRLIRPIPIVRACWYHHE